MVSQGVLMPVMFEYVYRTATRVSFEHSIADWELLREAGFTEGADDGEVVASGLLQNGCAGRSTSTCSTARGVEVSPAGTC
jgi:hypothetical protein